MLFINELHKASSFKIAILTLLGAFQKCGLGISLFRETHISNQILVLIFQEHHLPKLTPCATLESTSFCTPFTKFEGLMSQLPLIRGPHLPSVFRYGILFGNLPRLSLLSLPYSWNKRDAMSCFA